MVKKMLIVIIIMTAFTLSPNVNPRDNVSYGSQNYHPEKIDPIHPTK